MSFRSTFILRNVLLSRLRLETFSKPMAVRCNSSFYYLLHAYYENSPFSDLNIMLHMEQV
jgi:hypothetical protein